jgi:class 3 adenylate cyclase/tetratricopeptide (TPR) repeat protein
MTCAACGSANRQGRKFCSDCGAPLARACTSCGAANEPDDNFCGECGEGLVGAAADPASRAPTAERRLVSVLFADLVGFTALSEERDSEEVRELLSQYFAEARQVIERFGGTVEKFIGDAVMAVWGAPIAREDDAERAVRAALDLVAGVATLGADLGIGDLRARAAVLTGEAAVTVGAKGEGMVAGDLVNVASRIQSIAQAGTVLVGEATRRATESSIAYEAAGTHELKGKSEPIAAWRALRVIAARRGEGRAAGLEAPFVGRDAEIRLVKGLFHSAAEERKARLVSVVGVAGIGKSRLAWEFEKYLDGLLENVYWHRGRCLSYGDGVTYWALAEMVRMRARIAEGEPPETALAKLQAMLAEHVADAEEREWLEPRLAHLLGLAERTAPDREDLFSAWRLFFERLAEKGPTILVFEDLQWADDTLLDFIEYLLEWSRPFPLFVLTLSRPDIADRHPSWGAGKRDFTSLFLEPLAPAAMSELLGGLVPGLPAHARDRILERAEGIPLYAVETVRMLLDRGVLAHEGAEYRLVGSADALDVPETLHALIAARLDGLAPAERRVLEDASVLGKTFTKEGLSALSGVDPAELEPELSALVRKEILVLQTDPRSPERGHYGFLQALVQKVAHDTLSRRDRKARHLAAARYFESAWGDEDGELVEVVAAHYLDAYAAGPTDDDAAEIKAMARERLSQAGERAHSLAASSDAERYFKQAAELADDELIQAGLLERAGEMALRISRLTEAIELLTRARDLFASRDHSHAAARVSARLGHVRWHDGQIDTALEEMEHAYTVLAQDEPDEDLGALAAELARVQFFRGNGEEAARWIESALEIGERLALPELLSQSLNTKHLVLASSGRPEESIALLRHALAIALDNDLPNAALRAYFNLAHESAIRDRFADALAVDEQGLALTRKLGVRHYELMFLHHLTFDLYLLGEWDEALAVIEEMQELAPASRWTELSVRWYPGPAIDAYRGGTPALLESDITEEELADVQSRAGYEASRAQILLALGRPADALEAGEVAWALRDVLGLHSFAKQGLFAALEASYSLGDLDRVERLIADVGALAPGVTSPTLTAQSARYEAKLAASRGEHDRVEASFAAAETAFRKLAMPFPLAVVELEHAEWLTERGRAGEAQALLVEARAAFARLGARPSLERLDRLDQAAAAEAVPSS